MTTDKIIEEIKCLVERDKNSDKNLMQSFFDILFWKNYNNGYLPVGMKEEIFEQIKKNSETSYYDNDFEFLDLNTKKILPFINEIRKNINLPVLRLCKGNYFVEDTQENKEIQ